MLRSGGNEKLIVGYDLGREYAQISYCNADGSRDVETVSYVAGTENFSIPVVLCKRPGVNQWFYGREAIRYAEENGGILVENLLQLALDGEPVRIEENEFNPVALLTLFFKRSLGLLTGIAGTDCLDALMITCDGMDDAMRDMLEKMTANLRLGTDRISFQSHQESYYYYMLRTAGELWKEPSVLFEYSSSGMNFYRLECNKRTQPMVVFIHRESEEFPSLDSLKEREDKFQVLDAEFLSLAQEKIGEGRIGSVYLIGEDFSEEWLKNSLRFLCGGRRIFLGNNLFSKGACYSMLEQFAPGEKAGQYVFLGEDKLKSNIGMQIIRRGEETYMPLLDAGKRWADLNITLEFYLKEESSVELTVTSLTGGGKRVVPIELEGLSGDLARIKMFLHIENGNILVAEVHDQGFGEYRPAENRRWKQEIELI